ncbi:hypothetical protein Cgig2_025920 [Carnegiea gigantea]|uniref:Endonuclease/exonuclease/phosphatase domain-containing protein n=1 Tax=Carnegiea gigantea TaxID=171969 RepID=A0A9Q1JIU0_9CARY|nr:hypothetical protein Cgig2_025920 [Carnegiea gigantea]
MHSYVTRVSTNKKFYITFIYGMNHEHQRQQMWEDLKALSQQMTDVSCILGDFNAVLHKEDRRGGNAIQDTELKEMKDLLEYGELQEMRWNGAYFSWTNKTIWSRIDRALINLHWYETFDFTQNYFPPLSNQKGNSIIELARGELTKLQQKLQEEPESILAIQAEKEARDRYIDILSSSMALMRQQSKIEWISYGDDNTRTFFAKAKHRKLAFYIYQIRDTEGNLVEGFDKVGQAMMTFYKALLREQTTMRYKITQEALLRILKHSKSPGVHKQITSAIITATFYHIWSARNHKILKKQEITAHQTAYLIKDQVRSRILFLGKCSKKYSSHIDSILI